MSLNLLLTEELKQEATATRKLLERVPTDRNDWTPHAKSMPLGKLAMHVAEITSWVTMIVLTDELDFAKFDYKLNAPASIEDLLNNHDEQTSQAIEVLENCKEKDLKKEWILRTGENIHFTMTKHNALRKYAYNHLYHHRAQLGVYLRLLDVPLPGMYGPTADELAAMTNK
jgi:uncharacterized damage-inducible protein DinB